MKKKSYFKPDVKVHQFRPTAILAGSGPQASQNNEDYQEGQTSGWTWN